jgi:hypothetical protein
MFHLIIILLKTSLNESPRVSAILPLLAKINLEQRREIPCLVDGRQTKP